MLLSRSAKFKVFGCSLARVMQKFRPSQYRQATSVKASEGRYSSTLVSGQTTVATEEFGCDPGCREKIHIASMRRLVSPDRRQATHSRSGMRKMPSNPSIEGMPKRLRLLCTPHVKR